MVSCFHSRRLSQDRPGAIEPEISHDRTCSRTASQPKPSESLNLGTIIATQTLKSNTDESTCLATCSLVIWYNPGMSESDDLVDSALEFLRTSCDQYDNPDLEEARRLKHSTISLYTGIELFIKARLAREHWTLVLSNTDRYRKGDWDRGAFQSVGLRDAMARLSEVCGLDISQQAEGSFTDLADLRNKFVHIVCSESAERVTGIQLHAWHYFIDLLDHDFLQLSGNPAVIIHSIRSRMLRRVEFLETRFERVSSAIAERKNDGAEIIRCPFCGHSALAVGDGAACLVCGSSSSKAQEYAEEYARRSAPWMSSDEFYNTQWAAVCSECGKQACIAAPDELRSICEEILLRDEGVDGESGMDIEPWYCFNCGTAYSSFDIVECTRCGRQFGRVDDGSLCPTCSW